MYVSIYVVRDYLNQNKVNVITMFLCMQYRNTWTKSMNNNNNTGSESGLGQLFESGRVELPWTGEHNSIGREPTASGEET